MLGGIVTAPLAGAGPDTAGPTIDADPPAHALKLPSRHKAPVARHDRAGTTPKAGRTTDGAETSAGTGHWSDLVVRQSGPGAGQLRTHYGNGSTTSDPWTEAPLNTAAAWDFADILLLADITGDGLADILAREPGLDNGTLWIYPNDGSGSADPWTNRYAAGNGWNTVNTIQLADVTDDGRPDIVARNPARDSGLLNVYPHNGSTTSNPYTSVFAAGTGWNLAKDIRLADFTGDGHPDIMIRDSNDHLAVYPNNGSTTGNPWTTAPDRISEADWNWADTLALTDVTGDQQPDLIALDPTGALWIYPNNGLGQPFTAPRLAAGNGWGYTDTLQIGDVNGDGKPDIVGRVPSGSDLWIYPNNHSTGGPPWTDRVAAGTEWVGIDLVRTADVTGDGRPDLVTRDPSTDNGTLWVYPHNGSTSGSPWDSRYRAGFGWNTMTSILLGELTGDGKADVLGRDAQGNLWVYPGNGSSQSFPWNSRMWAGSGWNTARLLALADVDGDHIDDLIDLEKDGSLWLYPTGVSTVPVNIPGDWSGATAIDLGDTTASGRPDLVIKEGSDLWIYPNTGPEGGNPWSTPRRPAGSGWDGALNLAVT